MGLTHGVMRWTEVPLSQLRKTRRMLWECAWEGVIPLVSDLLSALWDGRWGWIHIHEAQAGLGPGVWMWSWLPRWVVEAMSVLCSANV